MASPPLAPTLRPRQRYVDNLRLVSGCIPYRLTKDNEQQSDDMENRIKVLMVSSPNRNDLVFPKGGWEDGETVEEAACREAFEEAGVKGILNEIPLGIWEFRSKSSQDICSMEGGCRGCMFAMEVTDELEAWPEKEIHNRKWLNIKEAFSLCRYEWMRNALEKFLRAITAAKTIETSKENKTELPSADLPSTTDSDGLDCPPVSPSSHASSSQHHDANPLVSLSWHAPPKRLPLTSVIDK